MASIGSILTAVYRTRVAASEPSDEAVTTAHESIGAPLALAERSGELAASNLTEVVSDAFTKGYRISLLAAAIIAGVTAIAIKHLGPPHGPAD